MVKREIPIRNATLTTIAPTGSISIIAGCSSGIEPLFGLAYKRQNVLDDDELFEINPIFEQVMREAGLYSDDLVEQVSKNAGSLSGIDEIPQDIVDTFRVSSFSNFPILNKLGGDSLSVILTLFRDHLCFLVFSSQKSILRTNR